MKYILDLNDKPFKAIKSGTKKVDLRCFDISGHKPIEISAADKN